MFQPILTGSQVSILATPNQLLSSISDAYSPGTVEFSRIIWPMPIFHFQFHWRMLLWLVYQVAWHIHLQSPTTIFWRKWSHHAPCGTCSTVCFNIHKGSTDYSSSTATSQSGRACITPLEAFLWENHGVLTESAPCWAQPGSQPRNLCCLCSTCLINN